MVTSSTQQTAKSIEDKKSADAPADSQNTLGTTLMEIQKLISDIENPFTLVGKMISTLGKDKTLETLTGEMKGGDSKPEEKPNSPQSPKSLTPQEQLAPLLEALSDPASEKGLLPLSSPQSFSSKLPAQEPGRESQSTLTDSLNQSGPSNREKSSSLPAEVQRSTTADAPVSRFVTEVRERIVTNSHPNTDSRETSAQQQAAMDFMRYMNSIELANFLANRFGREGAIDVLGSYVKRNWIKEEIARSLLDATTILSKNDLSVIDRGAKEATVEDHRVALYLIEEYSQSLFSYSLSVKFQDLLLLIRDISSHDSNTKNSRTSDYDSHDLR